MTALVHEAPPRALPTWVLVVETFVRCLAALVFLTPLAPTVAIAAALAGLIAAPFLSRFCATMRLRTRALLALVLAIVVFGQVLTGLLGLLGALQGMLLLGDATSFFTGGLALGLLLSWSTGLFRGVALLEALLVVAIAAHALAAHRHLNLHQPRGLADWALARGIEPEAVLAALGLAAMLLSALLLLRRRLGAGILGLVLLALLAGWGYLYGGLTPRLGTPRPDDLGLSKESESQRSRNRDNSHVPVAVTILHDELPNAPVLYLRQGVRSRLMGRLLVADESGRYDEDIPRSLPKGAKETLPLPQAPEFHREVKTTMYLLADHGEPPGLGFPKEFTPADNPNPRRFRAAYDVTSLMALRTPDRLLGRSVVPRDWSPERRAYYLAVPDDPRYHELSQRIVDGIDPRFFGDEMMKALAIRQYLERNGFYTLSEKEVVGADPIGHFLFESLRGYCVHFAHAAVFLLRSQGIPARVATGYGVDAVARSVGSVLLVYGTDAHAWPELYVDGVGWVTFDIYPERSDEPLRPHMDQDLASLFGDIARNEVALGKRTTPSSFSFALVGYGILTLLGTCLVIAFAVKLVRRLRDGTPDRAYRAVLDAVADHGLRRHFGESRERHARRIAAQAPGFVALTHTYLAHALGRPLSTDEARAFVVSARAVRDELHRHASRSRRTAARFNPLGWCFTR